jgi:hypothetical protein
MVIRPVRREDIARIDEIYRQGHDDAFSLPSLENQITSAVVEKDGKIIGFGVVKIYAEVITVLALDESKADRFEALQLLMSEAERACAETGIDQVHGYVQDHLFQRVLEKRFGFKVATGVALVKEI